MAHIKNTKLGIIPHAYEKARILSLFPTGITGDVEAGELGLLKLLDEYYDFLSIRGQAAKLEIVSTANTFRQSNEEGVDVNLPASGGNGTGLTVNISVFIEQNSDAGKIVSATINNPGQDYLLNDKVTIGVDSSTAELEITELNSGPSDVIARINSSRDLDDASDSFIDQIQEEIAKNVPTAQKLSKRELYKKIVSFYKSKGSEESIKAFFNIFYDDQVTFSYPSDVTLKPSVGESTTIVNQSQVDINQEVTSESGTRRHEQTPILESIVAEELATTLFKPLSSSSPKILTPVNTAVTATSTNGVYQDSSPILANTITLSGFQPDPSQINFDVRLAQLDDPYEYGTDFPTGSYAGSGLYKPFGTQNNAVRWWKPEKSLPILYTNTNNSPRAFYDFKDTFHNNAITHDYLTFTSLINVGNKNSPDNLNSVWSFEINASGDLVDIANGGSNTGFAGNATQMRSGITFVDSNARLDLPPYQNENTLFDNTYVNDYTSTVLGFENENAIQIIRPAINSTYIYNSPRFRSVANEYIKILKLDNKWSIVNCRKAYDEIQTITLSGSPTASIVSTTNIGTTVTTNFNFNGTYTQSSIIRPSWIGGSAVTGSRLYGAPSYWGSPTNITHTVPNKPTWSDYSLVVTGNSNCPLHGTYNYSSLQVTNANPYTAQVKYVHSNCPTNEIIQSYGVGANVASNETYFNKIGHITNTSLLQSPNNSPVFYLEDLQDLSGWELDSPSAKLGFVKRNKLTVTNNLDTFLNATYTLGNDGVYHASPTAENYFIKNTFDGVNKPASWKLRTEHTRSFTVVGSGSNLINGTYYRDGRGIGPSDPRGALYFKYPGDPALSYDSPGEILDINLIPRKTYKSGEFSTNGDRTIWYQFTADLSPNLGPLESFPSLYENFLSAGSGQPIFDNSDDTTAIAYQYFGPLQGHVFYSDRVGSTLGYLMATRDSSGNSPSYGFPPRGTANWVSSGHYDLSTETLREFGFGYFNPANSPAVNFDIIYSVYDSPDYGSALYPVGPSNNASPTVTPSGSFLEAQATFDLISNNYYRVTPYIQAKGVYSEAVKSGQATLTANDTQYDVGAIVEPISANKIPQTIDVFNSSMTGMATESPYKTTFTLYDPDSGATVAGRKVGPYGSYDKFVYTRSALNDIPAIDNNITIEYTTSYSNFSSFLPITNGWLLFNRNEVNEQGVPTTGEGITDTYANINTTHDTSLNYPAKGSWESVASSTATVSYNNTPYSSFPSNVPYFLKKVSGEDFVNDDTHKRFITKGIENPSYVNLFKANESADYPPKTSYRNLENTTGAVFKNTTRGGNITLAYTDITSDASPHKIYFQENSPSGIVYNNIISVNFSPVNNFGTKSGTIKASNQNSPGIIAAVSTNTVLEDPPHKTTSQQFYIFDHSPHLAFPLAYDSPGVIHSASDIKYTVTGAGVMDGTYLYNQNSTNDTPIYEKTDSPAKQIIITTVGASSPALVASNINAIGTRLRDTSSSPNEGVLGKNSPHNSPTGLGNYFDSPSTVGSVLEFGSTIKAIPKLIGVKVNTAIYPSKGTSVFTNKIQTANSTTKQEPSEILSSTKHTATNTTLAPNKNVYSNAHLSQLSFARDDRYKKTQHLIMPYSAAGTSFGAATTIAQKQNFFVKALEKSSVIYYDNCPTSASNTPTAVTMFAGQQRIFTSANTPSSDTPSIGVIKSTGKILVSTAAFDSPLQVPKGMSVLTPLHKNSHARNAGTLKIFDTNLNSYSPGSGEVRTYDILDGTSGNSSPRFTGVVINESPSTKEFIIADVDDGAGDDQIAGISRRSMTDTYIYGNSISDYCIISPFANTIQVTYKLFDESPTSKNGEYVYKTHTFNSSTSNASPKGVQVYGTDSPNWIRDNSPNYFAKPTLITHQSPAITPKLWRFKGRRPFALIINNLNQEETQIGVNTNLYNQTIDSSTTTVSGKLILARSNTQGAISQEGNVYATSQTETNLITFNPSLIDSRNKITDSNYYQDFSYEINTTIPIEDWAEQEENLIHPAGLKYFGNIGE